MYCVKCGYNLSDTDVFCRKCGTRVGTPASSSSTDETSNAVVSSNKGKFLKPLTCDMCGSNEVIKMDGLFTCQMEHGNEKVFGRI